MCKLKFTNIIKMSHTNICYCRRHTHHSMRSFFLSSCLGSLMIAQEYRIISHYLLCFFTGPLLGKCNIDLGGLDHFYKIGGKPNLCSACTFALMSVGLTGITVKNHKPIPIQQLPLVLL